MAIITGCAVQVKTHQKANQTFEDYETWCWLKGCEVVYQGPNQYFDKKVIDEIGNAIAFNMHEKGYIQKDDSSDLLLNFFIVVKEDSVSTLNEVDGMFNGIDNWASFSESAFDKYLKGSLIIDAIDRETSEVVWRSNAARYMELNPQYDRELIWKVVERAMKKFPSKE